MSETNLDKLSDRQIELLLRAAGFSDDEIANMDRDAQEAALSANAEEEGGSIGFPPAPEGEEAEYALLRHRGYTDEQIAAMDEVERDAAIGEPDPDMVTAALLRDGYTAGEIAGMSDQEKMELIDPNDVLMYEALKEAGYTDEQIGEMSLDEKADAVDLQTRLEDEALEAAGYYPDDLSPGARQDALMDIANNPDDYPEPFPEDEPEPDVDPDIDVEVEDPNDTEDDELSDDEAESGESSDTQETDPEPPRDLAGGSSYSSDDPGWSEIDEHSIETTKDLSGFSHDETLVMHGGTSDGSRAWESEEEAETSLGSDGFHRGRSTTTLVEDATGVAATETTTVIDVGPRGAAAGSEFHEVSLNNDGSVETIDRERQAELDESGADYSRIRNHVTLEADGSSTEEGDRTQIAAGDDGLHIGRGRTDLSTDADGNVTGTDADTDLTVQGGEMSLQDEFDSTAEGGLLGDRGISRHVEFELGDEGFESAGDGSVTFAGRTVEVGHDVAISTEGASVELGGQEINIEFAPPSLPPFQVATEFVINEMPDESGFDFTDPPVPDEVVDDVLDFVDDNPPPPPPPIDDVADDVGDALGGLFG